MIRKNLVMIGLLVIIGGGSARADHPVGTVWHPAYGDEANVESLPIIDSVTGNPIQAMYVIGSNLNRNTGTYGMGSHWQNLEIDETHDYANYITGALMDAKPEFGGRWYLAAKYTDRSTPRYGIFENAQIQTDAFDYYSVVWAFIAPQTGYYKISGDMFVVKHAGNVSNPVEIFTFTGTENAYIKLESFDALQSVTGTLDVDQVPAPGSFPGITYSITPQIAYLQTGEKLCIAVYGGYNGTGPGSYEGGQAQRATVDLNKTETNSLVSVTLVSAQVSVPMISPNGGTFANRKTITISCITPGATIRYTTNGIDPTSSTGTPYTVPFDVTDNMTVKAKAFKAGIADSEVSSAAFVITHPLNPVGTVWHPLTASTGANVESLPIIDSVTGNPIQAIYAVGSNYNRSTGQGYGSHWHDLEIAETRNYDNYTGSMMNYRSPGSFWKHSTKQLWDCPQYDMYQKARLTTSVYEQYSAVWAFIAPQDGTYELSGTLHVVKSNSNPLLDCPVEVFTFTGLSHGYTNIATFDSTVNVVNDYTIPTTTMTLQKGDMISVAAYGGCTAVGPGLWESYGIQRVMCDINNPETSSQVTIELKPTMTATPVISPNGGAFTSPQTVTITCADDAMIRYTTNGSDPASGTVYTGPFTVTSATVKAQATASGKVASLIATAVFSLPAATPTFSMSDGNYSMPISVVISCTTPGASIYYTTDNSTPTQTNGTHYTVPVIVTSTQTLKAVALATGFDPSNVGSTTYTFPSFNRPEVIPYGTAPMTGDVSVDWAGATWTRIDQPYWGPDPQGGSYLDDPTWIPTDISQTGTGGAYYAAKWTPTAIYLAVKVYDTNQVLTDTYDTWNTRDAVEIYLHTSAIGSSEDYASTFKDAQQYAIGVMGSVPTTVWKTLGDGTLPLTYTGFQAAGKSTGGWLYYEAKLIPFKQLDAATGGTSISNTLKGGDVIGLDVVVGSYDGAQYGMIAENQLRWKSSDYAKFGLHTLAFSNIDLSAVIAAMDSKSGGPGWNANADFDYDGEITSSDLSIVLANMP